MSKITNDGLTRSGTGCFYSCTHYGNSRRHSVRGLTGSRAVGFALPEVKRGWRMERETRRWHTSPHR